MAIPNNVKVQELSSEGIRSENTDQLLHVQGRQNLNKSKEKFLVKKTV